MRMTLGGSFMRRHFGMVFGGIWLAAGTVFLIVREGESDLDVHLWEQLTERGPVAIPDDPSSNRIARETDWVQAAVFGGLGEFLRSPAGSSASSR